LLSTIIGNYRQILKSQTNLEYDSNILTKSIEKILRQNSKEKLRNYCQTMSSKKEYGTLERLHSKSYKPMNLEADVPFLLGSLIESKRFPEGYFSQFYMGENEKGIIAKQIPFEFQTHFNHGVMNSLGIPKYPNERFVHFNHMLDSTNSKNKQELIKWLQENLKGQ